MADWKEGPFEHGVGIQAVACIEAHDSPVSYFVRAPNVAQAEHDRKRLLGILKVLETGPSDAVMEVYLGTDHPDDIKVGREAFVELLEAAING